MTDCVKHIKDASGLSEGDVARIINELSMVCKAKVNERAFLWNQTNERGDEAVRQAHLRKTQVAVITEALGVNLVEGKAPDNHLAPKTLISVPSTGEGKFSRRPFISQVRQHVRTGHVLPWRHFRRRPQHHKLCILRRDTRQHQAGGERPSRFIPLSRTAFHESLLHEGNRGLPHHKSD